MSGENTTDKVRIPDFAGAIADPQGLAAALTEPVHAAMRAALKAHFEQEGRPDAWATLAESTVKERQRLLKKGLLAAGAGETNPILFRTGALKKELLDPGAKGHVETAKVVEGAVVLTMGASSPQARGLNNGYAEGNLPPRPIAVVSREAAREIAKIAAAAAVEHIRANLRRGR